MASISVVTFSLWMLSSGSFFNTLVRRLPEPMSLFRSPLVVASSGLTASSCANRDNNITCVLVITIVIWCLKGGTHWGTNPWQSSTDVLGVVWVRLGQSDGMSSLYDRADPGSHGLVFPTKLQQVCTKVMAVWRQTRAAKSQILGMNWGKHQ